MFVPREFRCSINNIILTRPATCSDGSTYEYESLKDWLEVFDVSPTTGQLLPTKEIVENLVLKQKIEEWREQNGVPIEEYNVFANPGYGALRQRILRVLKEAPIHFSNILSYARKFEGWHGDDSKCDDACDHKIHTLGHVCRHGYSRPRCICNHYRHMGHYDTGLARLPDTDGEEEVVNDLDRVFTIVPQGRQYLGSCTGLKLSPERYLNGIKEMGWFDENEEIDLELVRVKRLFTVHFNVGENNEFWPPLYEPTKDDTVPVFKGTYQIGHNVYDFDIPDLEYKDPTFDGLHPTIKCMFKRWAFSRILGGCFFKKVTLDLAFLGSVGLLRKDSPQYIRLMKSLRYQCPETCKQCQITNIAAYRNRHEDWMRSSYGKYRTR